MPIIFVLGGPGSGKGTQCERIVKRYGCAHLSAGDLLRAEVESGSTRGTEMGRLMAEGKLVPQEWVIELLRGGIARAVAGKGAAGGCLIDGFPRAVDQAQLFEASLGRCQFMLWFDCDEATMEKRLLKRGETSGRADDNAASIKKRFRTFVEVSKPVLELFQRDGRARVVDATRDTDVVFADVCRVFDTDLPAQ